MSSSFSLSCANKFDCLFNGELTVSGIGKLPTESFPCSVNRAEHSKTRFPSFGQPICRKPRSKRSRMIHGMTDSKKYLGFSLCALRVRHIIGLGVASEHT